MMNDYTPTLKYQRDSQLYPIPPSEQLLQTVTAEPWLHVSTEPLILEGMSFDRDGNMWFVEDVTCRIHKVDMKTKKDTVVYEDPQRRSMSACKHHKDGRVFIPSVGPDFKHGYLFTMNPDGTDYKLLMEGHVFDDMVFDSSGGFYYTHFTGDISNPDGGVYYVWPDHKTVTPVVNNLAGPNGVALSTNEKVLWITETNAGRLIRAGLGEGPTTLNACTGVTVPYKFTGGVGPDSCYVDNDDNLYVAMYGQGRVMVFNRNGFPIGQVLLPGRENGYHQRSTHPTIRPGTNELYICTHDDEKGAWIFKAGAFAEANKNGYQFK
jgi:lactonase